METRRVEPVHPEPELNGEEPRLDVNPLSERERDVARLLATGASNAEIARDLIISPHTVKVHLRNIFEKLQVNSRTEASMLLVQRGWIDLPGGMAIPRIDEQPVAIPEPEPLADLPPPQQPWQRAYLVAVLALLFLALAAPIWRSQARTSAPLLTDAGIRSTGAPRITPDARWQELAPLPTARSRHAVARVENVLYVLGGEGEGGRRLRAVDGYDLSTNRWRALAPLPEAASNLAAAALGDTIYVAGGTTSVNREGDATLAAKLWGYSVAENAWREVGSLPASLAGAALTADETSLYLVGGWDGAAMRDEIWSWTPGPSNESPRWELAGRLDSGRAFLGAVVVDDELYTVGGFDGQRELARADAYALAESRWRALPPMATARSGFALVYDGLALVALGGGWLDQVETNERYDPTIDVWSNFPSPVAGSWRHLAAASLDGRLYLVGGWSGDYLDTLIQYQSTFRALLPVITNP